MKVGRKAQGHDMSLGEAGTKSVFREKSEHVGRDEASRRTLLGRQR